MYVAHLMLSGFWAHQKREYRLKVYEKNFPLKKGNHIYNNLCAIPMYPINDREEGGGVSYTCTYKQFGRVMSGT